MPAKKTSIGSNSSGSGSQDLGSMPYRPTLKKVLDRCSSIRRQQESDASGERNGTTGI